MINDSEGFEALVEEECITLLGSSEVGRIAVTTGAVPAIFPVNYRLLDGQIVIRTGHDTKLHRASESAVVAFEVDHVDPVRHEGWSVLAVGVARNVNDPAVAASLRDRLPPPWAPGERDDVIAIVPEFVSGRRIGPAA